MSRPVFRFAPSPNGRLHLGHAYSALLNADLARRAGGRLLVRIEDIDPVRSRPEHEAAILDDLAWLGLAWEEPVRRQSEHLADYAAAIDRLRDARLAYPCTCSRAEIAAAAERRASETGRPVARDPDGAPLYPGTCRGRGHDAARDGAAIRLDTARALAHVAHGLRWTKVDETAQETSVDARPERWGDPVIARRDVPTSYHLSVAHDDALQGVTDVVRGRDLEAATDLHVLLQALLGWERPRYLHHDLVLGPDGTKLSKSLGARPLATLRAEGRTPADIRAAVGLARPG